MPLLVAISGVGLANCEPSVQDASEGDGGSGPSTTASTSATTSIASTGAGGTGAGGVGPCPGEPWLPKGVAACLTPPGMLGDTYVLPAIEVDGTVIAVSGQGTCFVGATGLHIPQDSSSSVVVVELQDASAQTWKVGFRVPGFDESDVAIGATMHVSAESKEASVTMYGRYAHISLAQNGATRVAVGENKSADVAVTTGAVVCQSEPPASCGVMQYEMNATVATATATIPIGESAVVGGLMVTNAAFFEAYSTPSNACNFMPALQYVVGAAAP